MATKVALQMDFLTDSGKNVRISIASPKQPVDAAAVSNAMDLIVSKNIFAYPQGAITKKVGATLVQTDSSAIV